MRRELEGDLVLDASVLVELVFSTKNGLYVRQRLLSGAIGAHAGEIAMVELKYVLCRKLGWRVAREKTEKLVNSGYIVIEDLTPIVNLIARYKCERRISIGDCSTLALSKHLKMPALFSRREGELAKEAVKKPFDTQLLFLDEISQ
ncbi:MAG: PIN domain-containing protein [Thermoproteota archaeon]